MSRMRVLFYTRPAYLDPALSFIQDLSRLVELHIVLEVAPESWSSALFDLPPRALPAGITPADPVLRDCFPAGVRSYWQDAAGFHLSVHTHPKSLHPATVRTSVQTARFIRSLAPDVAHFDDVSVRFAAAQPALGRTPLVLSLHDPEPHSGERNWRVDLARRLVFGRAQRFILHNAALRPAFCRAYRVPPSRVATIPLGAYHIFREWSAAPPPAANGPTLLFFGRLSPYKGLDVLYAAAAQAAQAIPGLTLIVAGRPIRGYQPPDPPTLANGGRVEVIDRYVANQHLAALFTRATLVVCPYRDATQSGVVLTAYAFGKPVVATRVGGLPEYVADQETGLLVPPDDSAALAAALVGALGDPAVARRLEDGVRARYANGGDWASSAERTLRVYEDAARGAQRSSGAMTHLAGQLNQDGAQGQV